MERLAGILVSGVRVVVIAAAILVPAAVVCAQGEVPAPQLHRGPPIWLGYLVMFGLLTAVMLVSLMPSKRGHQD